MDKTPNALKMEKFQAIRTKCEEIRALSPLTITSKAKPPVTTEPHAYVTLALPLPTVITNLKARMMFSRLFVDADSVIVANTDNGIAFSFCVENVWNEEGE